MTTGGSEAVHAAGKPQGNQAMKTMEKPGAGRGRGGRRQVKKEIFALLETTGPAGLAGKLAGYPPHIAVNALFMALCHPHETVRWHAVCAFGALIPAMADKDPESARMVMRRLLWSLNDESGGIGWGAPEAMAEIMCRSSLLRQEYLHMLFSYIREDGGELFQDGNYLELPPLQRGVLWGIGRIAEVHRAEMPGREFAGDIAAYLSSADLQVVGLAIWCLGLLGTATEAPRIAAFLDHPGEIQLFLNSSMKTVTLGELAAASLARLSP